MRFEKVGKYWMLPLYTKVWMNVKYWFKGLWMFIKVLFNYQESVVENEMTLWDAWHLCHSLQEARMGKTLRIVDDSGENSED